MIRFQFYTGVWVLLFRMTFCFYSEDLRNIYGSIRGDICKFTDAVDSGSLKYYTNNFDEYWNFTDESKALSDIKNEWDFFISDRDCPKNGYTGYFRETAYADMKCFIRDLQIVGPIFKEDLVRFADLRSNIDWSTCSAFKVFMSAWHLHPVISRLNCYNEGASRYQAYALYQYVYNSGLNWAGTPTSDWHTDPYLVDKIKYQMGCDSFYNSTVAQGLRQEIDKLCAFSTTEPICRLRGVLEIADKVDKLLRYVSSSAPVTQQYLNATQLVMYAVVREMNKLYPDWIANIPSKAGKDYQFQSTYLSTSWVDSKVKSIIDYIFNNMDYVYNTVTNRERQMYYLMDLLPTNYHCEKSAQFGSLCWTIGAFDGMVKTLKQNANTQDTKRKVTVNTAIDYKAFLEHTQTERLLKLSETSLSNLITVATELRDDIVHSLDQSIQQSAAESTNQITGALQSGFDSLRKHFQQEASFDKAIAKADIAFINGEITKYMDASNKLQEKVSKLVGNILYYGFVAATGDNAEAAAKLVAHFLSMFNPLKWLTGGTSAVDIMDATAEYTQSIATLLKTDTLKTAWNKLSYYSRYFAKKLAGNQAYLENIDKLVKSLSADTPPSDFEEQKKKFIKGYNYYSPGVNIEDLTEVNTYWELLIDEACDLIDSTSGIVSGATKIAMGSDCFDAPGEVQKLMALNEEIFDFQFDMMDALTECVRASNGYASASTITTGLVNVKEVVSKDRNSNVLTELRLLAAYSSMLYRITVLTAKENYCNVLEYREGSRPELCKTHDWNLANLLSRTQSQYHSTQDFKTVPTRPAFSGDKAFIDLKDLYAGKVVRFQVPNSDWLVNKGWISSNDRHKPIFVQRFEVYLPVSSTSERQVSVKAEATVGNQLRRDSDGSGTEYVINPRRPLTFAYKEGQGTCRNEKIPNPYSNDCRTMPDLCQVSTDITGAAQQGSVYPSIYALWHIQLSGYESANLSLPVTNIDLKIGLQTATPVGSRRKRSMANELESKHRSRRSFGTQQCCDENMYVNETAMCDLCPPNSEAKYNALLCECKPCENGGRLLQGSRSCSCLCGSEYEGQYCEIRKCIVGEEFKCNNTLCIPESKFCDKAYDCEDHSDEPEGCDRTSQNDCDDGFCCSLFFDEENCAFFGEQCVPKSWLCDGNYDCNSKKDEANCVEGGQPSNDTSCPEGWLFYAGACWHFVNFDNETKNGTEAAEYCQEAGGTLAEFRNETEHWFAYTLFIYTISGRTVTPSEYADLMTIWWGVSNANSASGLSMFESGIWWIGTFDPTLTHLSHGTSDNGNNTSANETDETTPEKCVAVGKGDWKYSEQDCGASAEGLICTYRAAEPTPAPSQGPNVISGNQGLLGNETVAEINAGFQNLHDGMQDVNKEMGEISGGLKIIQKALLKGFEGVNDNLRLLIEKLDQRDDSTGQSAANNENPDQNNENPGGNGSPSWNNENPDQSNENPGGNGSPSWNNENPDWNSWVNQNNDGETSTGSHHSSDWENHFPDWMTENQNNDGETSTGSHHSSDWENHFPDWMTENQNNDGETSTGSHHGFDWENQLPDWMTENQNSDGETSTASHHSSDWENQVPDWMNDPNFPFGNR